MGCAWPDPDGHRHTAEFCENGAKAVAEEATRERVDAGVLRRRTPSPTWPSAPTTGSASRAGSPTRWSSRPGGDALRADRLGRRVRRSSPPSCSGLAQPGRGGLLHLGPDLATRRRSSTSCSSGRSARTTCPTARTCATSRPASPCAETIGIGKGSVTLDDIHAGRPDRHRRPEPGHQPPADAHRAGERQAQRRQDRRDQPAAARPG